MSSPQVGWCATINLGGLYVTAKIPAHLRGVVTVGCFVEIINYSPRVFAPVDKPEVLGAVLKRFPVEHLLEGAAA